MAQARFGRSFEVIVSQSDFAIASHMVGYNNCKQKFKGYTILTYATPRQVIKYIIKSHLVALKKKILN